MNEDELFSLVTNKSNKDCLVAAPLNESGSVKALSTSWLPGQIIIFACLLLIASKVPQAISLLVHTHRVAHYLPNLR